MVNSKVYAMIVYKIKEIGARLLLLSTFLVTIVLCTEVMLYLVVLIAGNKLFERDLAHQCLFCRDRHWLKRIKTNKQKTRRELPTSFQSQFVRMLSTGKGYSTVKSLFKCEIESREDTKMRERAICCVNFGFYEYIFLILKGN